MDHASLGVLPATTEFNPNVALECASRGVPFLITRGNGLVLSVPEEFLFTPNDQKELERKMLAILTDPHSALPILPAWTWEDVVSANIKIIKKICAS